MYAKPKFRKSRFRDPMYFWVILGDYKLWGPDYIMIKLAIFKVLVFLANLMHEFPLFPWINIRIGVITPFIAL